MANKTRRLSPKTTATKDENTKLNNITNGGVHEVKINAGKGDLSKTNVITFKSLQEGDVFDKDIRRIMAIINGVEQEFNEKKISKDF